MFWTPERINHSMLNKIKIDFSLEALIMKLKLKPFWIHNAKARITGEDPVVWKN